MVIPKLSAEDILKALLGADEIHSFTTKQYMDTRFQGTAVEYTVNASKRIGGPFIEERCYKINIQCIP